MHWTGDHPTVHFTIKRWLRIFWFIITGNKILIEPDLKKERNHK